MKRFDFNIILKCYAGKKLLKSHVENKLKKKKIDIFFQISPYSLFCRKFLLSIALYCLSFLGDSNRKSF